LHSARRSRPALSGGLLRDSLRLNRPIGRHSN
jgi:hypothetical protein